MAQPLYLNAIILPVLAFAAWITCVPPFLWHCSQRNIPAASLIFFIIGGNLINSINPLIWPRDNVDKWWDGTGLCDVEVRFLVGMSVGLPACTTMTMRKLASVMDTKNITVAPSRKEVFREKVLEVLICWGYPLLLVIVYYVVQPIRYFIFGISGCVTAFNLSWVTIVLNAMWPPITAVFSSYYAAILCYRMYRYRRDFARLIAARDTTKSRFIRLAVISGINVMALVPYSFWILWLNASELNDTYSWDKVHGPDWNSIIKVPSEGKVRLDKWGQIATGFVVFATHGTGIDAYNTYKRILCTFGLGKLFPSLYHVSVEGSSTHSSFSTFCEQYSSKARTLFSNTATLTGSDSLANSDTVVGGSMMLSTHRSGSLQPTLSNDPILQRPQQEQHHHHDRPEPARIRDKPSLFSRLFRRRRNRDSPVLPFFAKKKVKEISISEKSPTDTLSSRIHTHAWASDSPTAVRASHEAGDRGVHVIKEVRQEDSFRKDTNT